jgi:hypothetical protein
MINRSNINIFQYIHLYVYYPHSSQEFTRKLPATVGNSR